MYCPSCDLLVELESNTIYTEKEAERTAEYLDKVAVEIRGDFDVKDVGSESRKTSPHGMEQIWEVYMATKSCANCGRYLDAKIYEVP